MALGRNTIHSVGERTFSDLENLSKLDLSTNKIQILAPGMFEGLGSLKDLNLMLNNISFLGSGLFEGLNNLTELDLGKNNFRHITADLLQGISSLASLEKLALYESNAQSIAPNAFKGFPNLKGLSSGFDKIGVMRRDMLGALTLFSQ